MASALAGRLARGLAAAAATARSRSTCGSAYTFQDIAYVENGHDKQALDVFINSQGPFPRAKQRVVVFLHGGSWQRGDRRHPLAPDVLYGNVGRACARAGFVGVVPSYRLAPAHPHPAAVSDVARVLAWVRRNAARYGGRGDDVVLVGHSAGAHLAALAAADSSWSDEAGGGGGGGASLRGFVGISGIYDLPRLAANPVGRSLVSTAFGTAPEAWPPASPLHRVRAASSALNAANGDAAAARAALASCPLLTLPSLLVSAERDFHLGGDADALAAALTAGRAGAVAAQGGDGTAAAAAAPVERHVCHGEDHFSLVLNFGKEGNALTQRVMHFIAAL